MTVRHDRLKVFLGASASMLAIWAAQSPAFAQEQSDPLPAESADDADETVVVTARRQAIQNAVERKRISDTIIDSVVADDAGHLPDTSITEVLQRVSGVAMVRFNLGDPDQFTVEGSGVQVRGLSGVTSLLNGREVFSANGGSGLSWGDVTPELMAAVDVFKATRSDMIAGGIGGAIDLRTKTPFDYDGFGFELAASASRGDLAEVTSPSISVLVSNRWETPIGEMGLLVDIAHSEFSSRSFNIGAEPFWRQLDPSGTFDRYIPGGFGYGDDRFNRTRDGIYEAFEWRPTNRLSIFQKAFVSEYASDNTGASVFAVRNDLGPASGANAIYDSNGALVQADSLIPVSLGQGNSGSLVGQSWLPVEQQVDCNAPYGEQAQSLNWGTLACDNQRIFTGSARAFGLSESSTRDFSQGFTWVGERLRVRGALQYVESTVDSDNFYVGTEAQISAFSVDLRGEFPDVRVSDPSELSERENYIWASMGSRAQHNRGIMYASHLDIDYELDGFFTEVSAGLQYADRKEKDDYEGTYWAALGRSWNGSAQRTLADGPLEDTELYAFNNFFRGDVSLPGQFWLPSASMLQQRGPVYAQTQYGYDNECAVDPNTGTRPSVVGCVLDPATSPPDYYPNTDGFSLAVTKPDTAALYVQTRFESERGLFGVPYNGNLGLRVVRNTVESSGNFVFNEGEFYLSQADANADLADDGLANNFLTVPLTGQFQYLENDYTRYLPAFNVNFNLTDDLFLRFAVNRTMSPPSYYDIRASGSASVTTTPNSNNDSNPQTPDAPNILQGLSANTGNPSLLPTLSTNLDVSLEWYGDNSNVHFSVFNKDLEDFIVYQDNTRPVTLTVNRVDGTSEALTATITTAEIVNAEEEATIRGFEIGGRKFFDELPGWLSGFGVEANYTYIDSENPSAKALDMHGQLMDEIPVTGLSEHNFNVQFLYEKYNWSLRAAYTWRDRYLTSTNTNGTNGSYNYYNDTTPEGDADDPFVDISLPVYAEPYGQLDLGASYQLGEKLRLWVQGSNVTNETAATTQGGYPNGGLYPRNFFVHDRRISAGINYSF